ncbi:MAG: hypothetical protein CL424_06390 [Acidimicrobiaceae bacterium]|nr:hypothetical protein [Acidimicrobiaceae bacterium]
MNSPSVIGLEHGRKRAAQQARRKNRSNTMKTGVLAVLAAGSVGLAAYVGYDYYQSEMESDSNGVTFQEVDPNEAIEILENQPRWNGPGNPAFGVGEAPASP